MAANQSREQSPGSARPATSGQTDPVDVIALVETIVAQQSQGYKEFAQELATALDKRLSERSQRGLRDEELQLSRAYSLLRSQLAGPADDDVVSPARIVGIQPESTSVGAEVTIHMRNAAALARVGFVNTAGGAEGVVPRVVPGTPPGAADQFYTATVPKSAVTGPVTVATSTGEVLTTDWNLRISEEDPSRQLDRLLLITFRGDRS